MRGHGAESMIRAYQELGKASRENAHMRKSYQGYKEMFQTTRNASAHDTKAHYNLGELSPSHIRGDRNPSTAQGFAVIPAAS